jgi:hypothetical protein
MKKIIEADIARIISVVEAVGTLYRKCKEVEKVTCSAFIVNYSPSSH